MYSMHACSHNTSVGFLNKVVRLYYIMPVLLLIPFIARLVSCISHVDVFIRTACCMYYAAVTNSSALSKVKQMEHSEDTAYVQFTSNTLRLNQCFSNC